MKTNGGTNMKVIYPVVNGLVPNLSSSGLERFNHKTCLNPFSIRPLKFKIVVILLPW